MKKSLGAMAFVLPAPAWVVGSYDGQGKPNAMTAAWGGICCSSPPCVGISLRKATYTYGNIIERKAFTVNVPSERYLEKVDYFGIASGRNVDKFAAAGLTPIGSDLVDAPYVEEFPLVLECKVIHTFEIGLHTQFIGEILDVKADESVLKAKRMPDIEKVRPFVYCPQIQTYHAVGEYLGQAHSIGKKIQQTK